MPFELSFTKQIEVADPDIYFNDCCHGGDVVSDELAPLVRDQYQGVQENQEDWGWFIWCRSGDVKLAIEIFCDDPVSGRFRVHLTSRIKRAIVFDRVADTSELETLREGVVDRLTHWTGTTPAVQRLDNNFMALGEG